MPPAIVGRSVRRAATPPRVACRYGRSHHMTQGDRALLLVVLLLGIALTVSPAQAAVSPLWQELGGSASGEGISQTSAPKAVFDTSVAVYADGKPVVAYADLAENDTQGAIVVKRWTGAAWETLSTAVGQGYLPQIRLSAAGDIFVAWLQDDGNGNTEIHLRKRASDGTTFDEIGGSDSAGGISGSNPGITFPFSLAVGTDGQPVVALLASAVTGIVDVTSTPAIIDGLLQVYVRRWTGSAWEFVGSDFTGPGASNAVSFDSAVVGSVLHSAETPALTIDTTGAPVVAFAYVTQVGDTLAANTDIYVTRWNGTSWDAVGPAVPAGDGPIGRGGAGGVSNSDTASLNPSLAAAPSGNLALAWEETSPDGSALYVWVRVWNGTSWIELAGSATDSGFTEPFTQNGVPQIAVGPDDRPVVAWNALASDSPAAQIFVRRWNGTDTWEEPAFHSAAQGGISDAALEAFAPALALTPAGGTGTAGVPTVAWMDMREDPASAQVFLRQLFAGATVSLAVGVSGGGLVTSDPIGVECRDACAADFVPGTSATLTATKATGATFLGWGGACAFRGTNTTCTLALNANASVTASFKQFRVSVAVATPAGTVGQGTLGTVTGDGIACAADGAGTCFADVAQGARVVLQAAPQPGNRFLNWLGGPCGGRTNATCEFTVAANSTSTALFRGVTGVRVLKAGNGSGTVTGTGFACGADCFEEVFTGTSVSLTPTPAAGSTFRGWTGDACDGKPTGVCTFVAAGNRSAPVLNQSVTATFQLNVQQLTVTRRTNGTVVSDPLPGDPIDCGTSTTACLGFYDYGTSVVLRATADPGAVFTGWTGVTCLAGGAANASCAFQLKANTTATPTFRPRTLVTVVKTGNGVGTVSGPGIACGADCSENEFDARLITLTAAPATGSRFTGWGDTCAFRGTNTSCAFVPAGATQSVSAAFELIPYTLTVTPRTNGNVANAEPLPDPIDCGSDGIGKCSAVLNYSTMVRLRATPIPGSKFVSWTGCTSVVGTNCSFTMTANRTVTATYRDVTSVSLTKTGQGTVNSTPAGIACGPACGGVTGEFARNVLVKLTPAPVTGWDFSGWSGDPSCPGTGPCSFNASTLSVAVAANFAIQLKMLKVTVVGSGSVTGPGGFACDATTTPCAQVFPYGTIETLTPVAAPGFKFTGWTQDCTGAVPTTCKPTMTANHSVTATFKQVFGVSVIRQGNAAPGAITTSPAGVNCGLDCAEDFLSNTLVTFSRAAPPAGRTFRWLGDCAFRGTNASCALTIDGNKTVIADYSLQQLGLTINRTGPGTVTGAPAGPCLTPNCVTIVDYGVPILLQAVPSASPQGEFVSWTGCTTVAGANCSITLTGNRTVVATFKPIVTGLVVQPASGDGTVPIAKGGKRQYSAIATLSDSTTEDVTSRATWSSGNTSVATVIATTGLVTGAGFGTTSISASYRSPGGSMADASTTVAADTLALNGVTVDCSPYGDPGGSLSCLPSGRGFEVECTATATFTHGGTADVTEQAAWSSTNAAVAKFFGLSDFGGQLLASFRIFAGTAAVRATVGSVVSSGNLSPINRWVVQGTPLNVTGVSVAPASIAFTDATPVQLTATAALTGTTGTAAACTAPSTRDFSLLTTWSSDNKPVATVTPAGLVTPVATGSATVHWEYPGTTVSGAVRQGDVLITVP